MAAPDENIRKIVEIFYKPNENQELIYTNSRAFLLFLYKAPKKLIAWMRIDISDLQKL